MIEAKAPNTHCPAIHVGKIELAPLDDFAPIATYLTRAKTNGIQLTTRSFPRGTIIDDGRLDFCKQGLGPAGLTMILDALGNEHPRLRHVLLGTNAIGDDGAKILGDRLSSGLALHTLYLGCNAIRSDGVIALARGLADQPHVRALWLKRNPIGSDGLAALLEVLPRTRIRTLDLTNCELGDSGLGELFAMLFRARLPIEHLFVGGNGLSDPEPVVRWLRDPSCALTSLYIGDSRLRNVGCRTLLETIADHPSLQALSLASNGVSADGLEGSARVSLSWLNLGASPATTVLGEEPNHFDDGSVPTVAAVCRRAPALRYLGLVGTDLSSRGVRALLSHVRLLPSPPRIHVGKGIARKLKRTARELAREGIEPNVPEDLRFIASVYR